MKTTKRQKIGSIAILTIFFAALMVILNGCGDSGSITSPTGSNNGNAGNVSFSLKNNDASADPQNLIVVTEAKALITEVEFEREGSAENVEIENAAIVIHFDLNGNLTEQLSSAVPQGNFTKVKFQIHKPEDSEPIPDPEFREGSSGNQRYSFIVKGTYNGSPFVYKSRKSANLVINLDDTFNFQSGNKNITMLFNKLGWFRNGQVEVDPRNSQNDDLIDDNLKNSIREAFEDNDHDGLPDHH